jgi:hypothetical protein
LRYRNVGTRDEMVGLVKRSGCYFGVGSSSANVLRHWRVLAAEGSDMLRCGVRNVNLTGLINWSTAGDIKPTCSLINFVTILLL